MDISLLDAVKAIAQPLATVAGAWYALLRISEKLKREREHELARASQEAKEAVSKVKMEMDAKVEAIKMDLRSTEVSVSKDIQHLKETHDGKIESLAEKIEALRDQLNDHHSQLVGFLTKLIEKQ